MDLREKPGKVQNFIEMLMRFRLISVVLLVVLAVSFLASGWAETVSLPLGASEALGMWFANVGDVSSAWASAKFIAVASIAFFVLCFVFQGIRGGIASIVSSALMLGALLALGGAENMPLVFMGVFALVSLVFLLFVKWSVACALFPFALGWVLLSGFLGFHTVNVGEGFNGWAVWAVFSALGFAVTVSFAFTVGTFLGKGMPQGGALVKSAQKTLIPVTIGSLLSVVALVFDMAQASTGAKIGATIYYWLTFVIWFFAFLFPTMTFAPWERLRAGNRRVEMKEKKKSSKK